MPILILKDGVASDLQDLGMCIDLSESGVAFETEVDLKITDIVKLVFDTEVGHCWSRYARVLYRNGLRYGAYFMDCD